MDKSIEEIWSKGFQDDKHLIPPVIVDLYNQKSILTVDKLKSASKKDNWSIIPIAVVTLIFLVLSSKPVLGLYMSSLMLAMFFLNRQRLQFLNTINTSESCFMYLNKIQIMIKNNVKFYTQLLGIGLPFIAYIGFCIYIYESNQLEYILESYSLTKLITASVIFLIACSFIGVCCFKLSNYLIYGRLTTKIDEMIDELELLKK
ncbi:hypothetical protein Q4566_09000 [Tamlana sp. 2_MG-2023]|uniref:hypothetical protein n=1 Tax=unclassified Tamlana TaxID=2614803 RepID=UPI0026E30EE2|nr:MULTISPECIES: hypothetical protein [unclassified Tamlana]MDO6760332.1 hypothetical protein [Tamlana sp. 2_MG-2023]MDO6789970.1 hypothetical protein [Tamlana sp. 1_MG-2023]